MAARRVGRVEGRRQRAELVCMCTLGSECAFALLHVLPGNQASWRAQDVHRHHRHGTASVVINSTMARTPPGRSGTAHGGSITGRPLARSRTGAAEPALGSQRTAAPRAGAGHRDGLHRARDDRRVRRASARPTAALGARSTRPHPESRPAGGASPHQCCTARRRTRWSTCSR